MPKSIIFSLIGKETIPNFRAYKEFYPQVLVHVFSDETQNESDFLEEMIQKVKTYLDRV